MEDLRVIILSNNDYQSSGLVKDLLELSLNNISIKDDSKNLFKSLSKNDFDFIFLDVDFLGFKKTFELAQDIELYIGKPYLMISSRKGFQKNKEKYENVKSEIGNYITFGIKKFNLLCEMINELNIFNNNSRIKKLRHYDFLYMVTDKVQIKKIEISSIIEVLKEDTDFRVKIEFVDTVCFKNLKIINMSYVSLTKYLSKDFVKVSEDRIVNKTKKKVANKM